MASWLHLGLSNTECSNVHPQFDDDGTAALPESLRVCVCVSILNVLTHVVIIYMSARWSRVWQILNLAGKKILITDSFDFFFFLRKQYIMNKIISFFFCALMLTTTEIWITCRTFDLKYFTLKKKKKAWNHTHSHRTDFTNSHVLYTGQLLTVLGERKVMSPARLVLLFLTWANILILADIISRALK